MSSTETTKKKTGQAYRETVPNHKGASNQAELTSATLPDCTVQLKKNVGEGQITQLPHTQKKQGGQEVS